MPDLSFSTELIRDLVEGKLPWDRTKQIISGYKDEDRFDKYLAILQEKLKWQERILLPLTDELYIIEKDGERLVKCSCGYEFGDYRQNWKLKAIIHVRESPEEIAELYPPAYPSRPAPELCEIREFYCPGCGAQLEVEVAPFGYPIIFDFLPDIDTFYREWLGKPLKTQKEFADLSSEFMKEWR